MTRIAIGVGAVVFVGACVLAAVGVRALVGPLLTVVVLVALIAGGNYFSARQGRRTPYPGPPPAPDAGTGPPPAPGSEARP